MATFDFIIVGGGVIGMTTARELACKGANVAIFERGKLGMEATWAAGGILSSMRPWAEHAASSMLSEQGKTLYQKYAETLKNETGIDPEYFRSGLVIIEAAHIQKLKTWAMKTQLTVDENYNDSSGIKFPGKAILLPDIAQIRPPKLIAALHESLKQLSISIFENTEVTDIVTKNNQFSHIEYKSGKTYADAIILTAGAWTQSLIKDLNSELQIKPIHGQMICIKPAERKLERMVLDGTHYLIPRMDGHMLIGSTMEDIGFSRETTVNAREELLNWTRTLCPDLGNAEIVKQWSGLRPATTEGKPVIGPIAGIKNIYVNAGHFRKGILQAPASAKLLSDYLSGQNSFTDIESFCLEGPEKLEIA